MRGPFSSTAETLDAAGPWIRLSEALAAATGEAAVVSAALDLAVGAVPDLRSVTLELGALTRSVRVMADPGALPAVSPALSDPGPARTAVPLTVAGQEVGALVFEAGAPRAFTPAEQQLFEALAGPVAAAAWRVTALPGVPGPSPVASADPGALVSLLESLGEAIVMCDARGRLVQFSAQAREMHGQDAQSIPPEAWATHYHLFTPDLSRPLTMREVPLYRAWQGETVRDVQIAIQVPGHAPRQMLVNGQPLVGPDGRLQGAVVAQRDVTRWHQQSRDLAEQAGALRAFVQFSESAAAAADLDALGRLVMDTLQVVLPGSSGVLYERRGDRWAAHSWTPDLSPELLTALQAGLPLDVPILAQTLRTHEPVFVDGWNEAEQGVAHTAQYDLVATYPVVQGRTVHAVLSVGQRAAGRWSEAQRATVRALGRSFSLLYERLNVTRQLLQQRDEIERRSETLEAFAVMSRDVAGETDRYVLIRRAQEIMLSLLSPGYALYWERADDHWALKSQVGDIGNPELQRLVDEHGLPLDAPALHTTWLTGVPNYQDDYAQGADTPAEMIRHVRAATAFQVRVDGEPVGMLAIGLFDQHTWTPVDRILLETAVYSLGLVLERAEVLRALERTNGELATSNQELEAFAYSASHDLRTPVRHVRGFADLALRALERGDVERVRQHLKIVSQGADRMTAMIDGLLRLSRAGRSDLERRSVPLAALVRQAQQDVATEFPAQDVRWHVDALPTVRGDPGTLQQVMTNLLSNAVKFADPRRPLHVRVWAEERADAWAIFVEDTGVGFDDQFVGKLFGAFQRLHTQQQFAGTGIGLATVRRIVTRHGGQVWAAGRLNVGATFGFTLPHGPAPGGQPGGAR